MRTWEGHGGRVAFIRTQLPDKTNNYPWTYRYMIELRHVYRDSITEHLGCLTIFLVVDVSWRTPSHFSLGTIHKLDSRNSCPLMPIYFSTPRIIWYQRGRLMENEGDFSQLLQMKLARFEPFQ